MNPIVSIIMGSTSDMPVLEKAAKLGVPIISEDDFLRMIGEKE